MVINDYIWLFLLIIALFLRVGSRIFFLIRRLVGVISRSSSVSMKSRHCSRLIIFVGQSPKAEDIEINVCKTKKLTNTRSSSADDHTGVNLYARSDEQGTSLLGVEQTVGDGLTGLERDQGSCLSVA